MENFIFCVLPAFYFLVSGKITVFRFQMYVQATAKIRNKANLKPKNWILFMLKIILGLQILQNVRKLRGIFKVLITDKDAVIIK